MYDSVLTGLQNMLEERKRNPDYQYSVVAFTDGKSNMGRRLEDFKRAYEQLPEDVRGIPVFMVLYGEAAEGDLKQLVAITGGKVFDARKTPLYAVFKDIRAVPMSGLLRWLNAPANWCGLLAATGVLRHGERRLQGQGRVEGRECLLRAPHRQQHIAEVVVRAGQARLQPHRVLQRRVGLRPVSPRHPQCAEIGGQFGIGGQQLTSPRQCVKRIFTEHLLTDRQGLPQRPLIRVAVQQISGLRDHLGIAAGLEKREKVLKPPHRAAPGRPSRRRPVAAHQLPDEQRPGQPQPRRRTPGAAGRRDRSRHAHGRGPEQGRAASDRQLLRRPARHRSGP
ncbi:hypothetical protein OSTOST_09895 [Ostertagia ostertagi]